MEGEFTVFTTTYGEDCVCSFRNVGFAMQRSGSSKDAFYRKGKEDPVEV